MFARTTGECTRMFSVFLVLLSFLSTVASFAFLNIMQLIANYVSSLSNSLPVILIDEFLFSTFWLPLFVCRLESNYVNC